MPQTMPLNEAIKFIQDGQTLALGGMTLYRRPIGFVLGLLQQAIRPRNLTLLAFTAGLESDLLVGAGCVKTIRTVYFGLEVFGFAPMFSEAVKKSEIEILEETELSIALGLRAQMLGQSFLPSSAWIGTDLPRLRPDVKQIQDPYSERLYMAFPAIACDVAVIHALAVDSLGNALLNQNLGIDKELPLIADTTIITYEEKVDQLGKSEDTYIIPYFMNDILVHLPRGAHASSCFPLYPLNGALILSYIDHCLAGDFENFTMSQLI